MELGNPSISCTNVVAQYIFPRVYNVYHMSATHGSCVVLAVFSARFLSALGHNLFLHLTGMFLLG
jgi:hypothetical protein